jgi:hypothetical protein
MVRWAALLFYPLLLGGAGSLAAQESEVDLELVLAIDVSRSIDGEEAQLQRDGYVSAFRHPEVINAIRSGPAGRIAVTYVEWAGPIFQGVVVPWTVIGNAEDAEAFAARLAAAPISREFGTSISLGLTFAAEQFGGSELTSARRVIDVSGDGPNNTGPPVTDVRDRIVAEGITINGLPVLLKEATTVSPYGIPDLDIYYEDCVIGGAGAFMITVADLAEFDKAVRRKLVLEISMTPPLLHRAAQTVREPRIDCMIGEKARGMFFER